MSSRTSPFLPSPLALSVAPLRLAFGPFWGQGGLGPSLASCRTTPALSRSCPIQHATASAPVADEAPRLFLRGIVVRLFVPLSSTSILWCHPEEEPLTGATQPTA